MNDDRNVSRRDVLSAAGGTGAALGLAGSLAATAVVGVAVTVVTAMRRGSPVDEILSYVEGEGMDVVVMGTHGRSGVSRFLLGSVAERVIRRSPVPVHVVRVESD